MAKPANGAAIVAENASKIFLDGTVVAAGNMVPKPPNIPGVRR